MFHAPNRGDRGTTTLEVAGMAPLIALLVVILIHAAAALYGVTTAQTASRQAARAYAQGGNPYSVARESVPGWMGVETHSFGPGHGVETIVDVPDIVPFWNLKVTRETVMP